MHSFLLKVEYLSHLAWEHLRIIPSPSLTCTKTCTIIATTGTLCWLHSVIWTLKSLHSLWNTIWQCSLLNQGVIMEWVCFHPEPDMRLGCLFPGLLFRKWRKRLRMWRGANLKCIFFFYGTSKVAVFSSPLLWFGKVARDPTVLCLCSL